MVFSSHIQLQTLSVHVQHTAPAAPARRMIRVKSESFASWQQHPTVSCTLSCCVTSRITIAATSDMHEDKLADGQDRNVTFMSYDIDQHIARLPMLFRNERLTLTHRSEQAVTIGPVNLGELAVNIHQSLLRSATNPGNSYGYSRPR